MHWQLADDIVSVARPHIWRVCNNRLQVDGIALVILFAAVQRCLVVMRCAAAMIVLMVIVRRGQMDMRPRMVILRGATGSMCVGNCGQLPGDVA